MAKPTLYWKSTCSTCRDAVKLLRDTSVAVDAIDTKKSPPTLAQVKAIVAAAGGVAAVLNTRHALVKERSWATKPPSVTEFAAAVAADVNVLRRPIILAGSKIIIGFDKPAYAALAKAD
jgi:arsenate reductase